MDKSLFDQQLSALKVARKTIAETDDFNALDKLVRRLRIDVILLESDENSYIQSTQIDTTDQLSYVSKETDYTREAVLNILDSFLIKVELLGSIYYN